LISNMCVDNRHSSVKWSHEAIPVAVLRNRQQLTTTESTTFQRQANLALGIDHGPFESGVGVVRRACGESRWSDCGCNARAILSVNIFIRQGRWTRAKGNNLLSKSRPFWPTRNLLDYVNVPSRHIIMTWY
jgi:hypothetical protein